MPRGIPKSPAPRPPGKRGRVPAASSFRLVAESTVPEVLFGATKGRESVYLKALQDLAAQPGRVMEVDNLTARSGIAAQARKHGITILFGEAGGKLYVKVLAVESAEELVLKKLEDGPLNLVEIESLLTKPHPHVRPSDITKTLSESGKIALRSVSGSPGVKKWHLV